MVKLSDALQLQTDSSFSRSSIESEPRVARSRLQAPLRPGDMSLCPKEVAHSRYRGRDTIPLCHATHCMHRAHLRLSRACCLLVLPEPLLVAPAVLPHPIDITAEFVGRGH